MTQGELDSAIRRALNIFDEWVEVTGAIHKRTVYYYEMQSIIEDAVHCGAQGALGVHTPLDAEMHDQDVSKDRRGYICIYGEEVTIVHPK